jgi:tetratricopeptide (TPR) repeat protein
MISKNHSGQRKVVVRGTPIRVVCANTLGAALRDRRRAVGARHNASVEARTAEAGRSLWKGLIERYDRVPHQYRTLKQYHLDAALFRGWCSMSPRRRWRARSIRPHAAAGGRAACTLARRSGTSRYGKRGRVTAAITVPRSPTAPSQSPSITTGRCGGSGFPTRFASTRRPDRFEYAPHLNQSIMRERSKQSRRPQRIPPPITSGRETFDAEPFLDDFPGDLGLVLWKTAQSIQLWAGLSPDQRLEAFTPEAFGNRLRHLHQAPVELDLVEWLVVAADVLRGAAEERPIAAAARRIAKWAEQKEALSTALAFMQASALTEPENPELSIEVGRLARANGDGGRAETWFRHAILTSRRIGSWVNYGTAYVALASVHRDRGNLPLARRAVMRALRSGRRHSLREVQGRAHHDLMEIALLGRKEKEAVRHARLALEFYGVGHPRLPALAGDAAYHWMLQGFFAPALRVFEALTGSFEKPWEKLFLQANIARAAGGANAKVAFESAWVEALNLATSPRARAWAPAALLDLARGACAIGELDRAQATARMAIEHAEEQGKHQIRFEAKALLEAILGERVAAATLRPDAPPRVPRAVDAFSSELITSLQPVGAIPKLAEAEMTGF